MKARFHYIFSLPLAFSLTLAILLSQSAYAQEIRPEGKVDSPYPSTGIRNCSSSRITFRLRSRNGNNARTFSLEPDDGDAYACFGDCSTADIDFAWPSGDWYQGMQPNEVWTYHGPGDWRH